MQVDDPTGPSGPCGPTGCAYSHDDCMSEVDNLLRKIHRDGIGSLEEDEREFLEEVAVYLRNKF